MIVTDGGFRPDGTFVHWPAHDTEKLTEAFRRAVLRLFVRRGIFEDEEARSMLEWPHSGFQVHDSVLVPDGDTDFALRLARYCARNPVALERMEYSRESKRVSYRSDKIEGPTAGTEKLDPLEFLARLITHIPDKRQVMTRYYGWYANRVRGTRKKLAENGPDVEPVTVEFATRQDLDHREKQRRWAELLRKIFEVDPLKCPNCAATMRIVAFITKQDVIDQILQHLRSKNSRAPPRDMVRASRSVVAPMFAQP
jgi:hypothetical protein